jgi:hypothetical protein
VDRRNRTGYSAQRIGRAPSSTELIVVTFIACEEYATSHHRIGRSVGANDPLWSRALYWLCWGLLGAMALYLVFGR